MNSQKRNNLLVAGPILCNFVTRRLFAIKKGFAAVLATTGPKFCLLVSQNKDNHKEYICYNLLVFIIFLCNKFYIDEALSPSLTMRRRNSADIQPSYVRARRVA